MLSVFVVWRYRKYDNNENEKYKWILKEASTRSWREITDELEDYE